MTLNGTTSNEYPLLLTQRKTQHTELKDSDRTWDKYSVSVWNYQNVYINEEGMKIYNRRLNLEKFRIVRKIVAVHGAA